MHIGIITLCALAVGCFGAPEKWGAGFSFGSEGTAELNSKAGVKLKDGLLFGDASGSASGDLDSYILGGAYHESNGNIIGINGGLNKTIGGAVQGGVHGEAGLNKDGSISAETNSTVSTTGYAGVSGHANIATGDNARREVAKYEGRNATLTGDEGTKTDLSPLIAIANNISNHIWLYFWLIVGLIIAIISCCCITVCTAYFKLVADVKNFKNEKLEMQNGSKEKGSELERDHIKVEMKDWE